MKQVIQKNIDKLFGLYYSGRLDDETKEIVQGWLLGDENQEAKDASIAMLFEKTMNSNHKPDEYTRRTLAAMQKELGFTGRKTRSFSAPVAQRKSFRYMLGGMVGAAAVVLAGLFILPSPQPATREVTMTAESGSGKVVLPDGSTLTLKGATTITLAENFTQNRQVRIDGEAFFSVVQDEQHPFTVESDDIIVTVLGTEFYMKAYEADTHAEVVLETGEIIVSSGDVNYTCKPYEKATIDKSKHTIDVNEIEESELLKLK